jgi:hypothetical protein
MTPVLAGSLIASGAILINDARIKNNRSSFRKMVDKAHESVGKTFDEGHKALSREGSKVANMATSAAAAVYTGAVASAAVAGGIVGGVATGTAAGLAAGKGVATDKSMKWDSASSAIKSAKSIATGAALGFGAGAAVGSAAGSMTGGHGAAKFIGANPMLDPSLAESFGAGFYGSSVGAAVGTMMAASTAGAVVTGAAYAKKAEKAMEAIEKEAMVTMDKAVQSGYAYGNGLKKTSADIMSNVESLSDGMLKEVGSSNKEVSGIIKDGVDNVRSNTKFFSDAAKDALSGAGEMLDKVGIQDIFEESTVAEEVEEAVGDFLESVGEFWEEAVETAEFELKELANAAVDSGVVGGKAGEVWVEAHSRAGHAIKGFWRAARGKG